MLTDTAASWERVAEWESMNAEDHEPPRRSDLPALMPYESSPSEAVLEILAEMEGC